MTVNRIGRKNFLTKLAAKRIEIRMRCKDGQNIDQIPFVFPHSFKMEQGKE